MLVPSVMTSSPPFETDVVMGDRLGQVSSATVVHQFIFVGTPCGEADVPLDDWSSRPFHPTVAGSRNLQQRGLVALPVTIVGRYLHLR
jgi:hypothetical protein